MIQNILHHQLKLSQVFGLPETFRTLTKRWGRGELLLLIALLCFTSHSAFSFPVINKNSAWQHHEYHSVNTASNRINPADTLQASSDSGNTKPDHPNRIPYKTERSIGEHLLALPSYLFTWTTWPLQYSIKLTEQKFPDLFEGKRPSVGVFPLFEVGGYAGTAYGLLLYHDNFLGNDHHLQLDLLFGSRDYNHLHLTYQLPELINTQSKLKLQGAYANDPVRTYYGTDQSRSYYQLEEIKGGLVYQESILKKSHYELEVGWRRMDVDLSNFSTEDEEEDPSTSFPERLTGETSLITIGPSIVVDLTNKGKRTNRGIRYIGGIRYKQSVWSDELHFISYNLGLHAFHPIPFLKENRRLAFRTQLQRVEPIGSATIPFYELPRLGSLKELRGYPTDRFRNDGSLLWSLSYRYPIWSFADVALFIDQGQVFDRFSDIHINNFHTSYGAGIHLYGDSGFAFRGEFAFSKEYSRLILSINPTF